MQVSSFPPDAAKNQSLELMQGQARAQEYAHRIAAGTQENEPNEQLRHMPETTEQAEPTL